MTQQISNGVIALPSSDVALAALELVTTHEPPAIANHSVRSYLFARLLARHRGLRPERDFDDQLLYLACVLHDIGLTQLADKDQRFEVDGADAAAGFLTGQGLSSPDVDVVWQAIALHSSGGIAERRDAVCQLTRGGIVLDIDAGPSVVGEADARAIHAAYPRLAMARVLTDAIVAQATAKSAKAPTYSLPEALLRERAERGVTRIERAASAGRWGE